MWFNFSGLLLVLLSLSFIPSAHAGIALGQTRVIFEAKNKEENITVRNGSDLPILVQSWLDGGKGTDTNVPFAVTPPLAKLGGKGQQLLRILFKGSGVPQDRESVVWLNVQEIPAETGGKNTLQIAVRQRIKVFYRPANLVGEVKDAPSSLQWTLDKGGKSLSVYNPSAYHVSTLQMKLGLGEQGAVVTERQMIAPGEKMIFPLAHAIASTKAELSFTSINDWGGQQAFKASLQSGISAQAQLVTQ
ncbi:molecular chaperone [Pseudomonas sp. P7759]|uniref:fimbrial biogenesis chaperone n=1 Tax=Pseudomonas sp. P7759 TaxID=2738831 RepID=UPI0015A0C87D|nr:molecular chaperone [Pseudomonas sp. P7759]NWC77454.1 molecular chaperone [Pseudomonas sp. P7759]